MNQEKRFSISKDVNGEIFVDVSEDILDVTDGESVARTIQKIIAERFNNLINANGQHIQINKTTNDEFRKSNSANHFLKNPSQAYNDKLRTIANADEILTSAKDWIGEKIKHVRKDDIVEFARGNIMYRVGSNGYVADILVGTRKNGSAVLYDLVNIYDKKITEAPVTMASQNDSQRRQDTSATDSISQSPDSVNRQFSVSGDENYKEAQLRIIESTNPAPNTYSTWIRTAEDIKTLAETLEDSDWVDVDTFNPDLTKDDILKAIESGKIKIYSSYPIENGVFVSPSYMEAESYSGDGQVYAKNADIRNVAWIDPTQGQYAEVFDPNTGESIQFSVAGDEALPSRDSDGQKLTKGQQEYFKFSKVRDAIGRLLKVYHASPTAGYTVFNGGKGNGNYRFGKYGGSVTFFTDSREMSDSYAPSAERTVRRISVYKVMTTGTAGGHDFIIYRTTQDYRGSRGAVVTSSRTYRKASGQQMSFEIAVIHSLSFLY